MNRFNGEDPPVPKGVAGRRQVISCGRSGLPDMQIDRDARRRGIADHFGEVGEEMRKRGRRLREEAMVPTALATGSSKRGPEGQGDRERTKRAPLPIEAEPMEDAPIPLDLERGRAVKRMAQEDAFNEYGPEGHVWAGRPWRG